MSALLAFLDACLSLDGMEGESSHLVKIPMPKGGRAGGGGEVTHRSATAHG